MTGAKNGTVPLGVLLKRSPTYAMSTSGGPIVVRDRVDYSVTRGGLRVWIALVVFVLLMGGLVSLLTESELSELAKAVDVDGDGDSDNVDDDEGDALHQESQRIEREKEERTPRRAERVQKAPEHPKKSSKSRILETVDDQGTDEGDAHVIVDVTPEPEETDEAEMEMLKAIPKKRKSKQPIKQEKDEENEEEPVIPVRKGAETEELSESENQDRFEIEEEMLESIGKNHHGKPEIIVDKPKFDAEEDESKPITVKYYRKKGKTMEDLKAARAAGVAEDLDLEIEDRKSCPKEGCDATTAPPSDTERPPTVRYFRRKGTPIGAKRLESDSVAEDEDESENEILTDESENEILNDESETTSQTDSPTKFERIETVGSIRYVRRKGVPLGSHIIGSKSVDHVSDDGDSSGTADENKKHVEPEPKISTKKIVEKVEEQTEELSEAAEPTVAKPKVPGNPTKKSSYRLTSITNREDNKIRTRIDDVDKLLNENKLEDALAGYEQLLKLHKNSPRLTYGRGRALDLLSEKRQSNPLLEQAIASYESVLRLPDVPDELLLLVADRLVDRARFRGWLQKAADVQRILVDKFPDRIDLRKSLGVTYLMMGRNQDAKRVFEDVLYLHPNDGFAQVHYGFILKTHDNDNEGAAKFLKDGIDSGAEGTVDGRWFFHLGDALQRLHRNEEAYEVYDKGAQLGVFLSKFQRSLYNCPGIFARPWWTLEQTSYAKKLKAIESQWQVIRDEGLALLDEGGKHFRIEDEKLTDKGDWRQFTLYERGRRDSKNCAKAPKTCAILEQFQEAIECKRGQIKFSLMNPGTKVWPHCGPTNCRLRGHLGLLVPAGPRIRVGNETRTWKQGKFIVFDDSFEHEVWHDGSKSRLVLIVDFWHPEVTKDQRASLSPI